MTADPDGLHLSPAGAGAARRIGLVPRPLAHPAATLVGKGTACWTDQAGERP